MPLQKIRLGIEQTFAGLAAHLRVSAIRLHDACACFVFKVLGKDAVAQTPDKPPVLDRKQYLHAPVQITRHEIGAAHVDPFIASVMEVVDAAVFEKTSNDAPHANGFADAGNTRTQRANPANNQIDLHTGLGRFVKEPNHAGIFESVHLQNHAAVAVLAMPFDFTANEPFQARAETMRSNQQLPVGLFL